MTVPPPPPPAPSTGPHKTVPRGLSGTLRGFLFAGAATALAGALATVNEIAKFNSFIDGDSRGAVARLFDAEEVSEGAIALFSICALVVLVLAIVWWFQAYQAIDKVGATGRSWSPGWAVGGFFIPVANLVIPKLVLNEIDRVSAAAEEGSIEWRDRPLLQQANLGWVLVVVALVLMVAGASITSDQLEGSGFDVSQYRLGLWLRAVGLALTVPAGLLGAASLRVFGQRVNR